MDIRIPMIVDTNMIEQSSEDIRHLMTTEVPMNVALKLHKFLKEITFVLGVYESKRKNLYTKYGEGDDLKIIKEHEEVFKQESSELLLQKFDINIDKIPTSSLGDIKIKPSVITNLEWLFEIE